MIRILASFLVFLALSLPSEAAKRVALVIGNADYKFIPALLNPLNDAALMETALKGAGFEVIRKDNLDQQGMKLALIEFSRTLKQGAEAGMFYYAGHGIEVDGRNYLVPIDSNMQSKEETDVFNFDVNNFMAMMENSGVPFNIMVLDACRNNPFRGMRSTGGGLAPMRAPLGSYVAYATAPGSIAADGEGANSPFTEALAANIAIEGLKLEEVFKRTRTKVRISTNGEQVPFDSSAIEGDFFFTLPVAKPTADLALNNKLPHASQPTKPAAPVLALGMKIEKLSTFHLYRYRHLDDAKGLIITHVEKGSTGFEAGLAAGDLITMIGSEPAVLPSEILSGIGKANQLGKKSLLLVVVKEGKGGAQSFMAVRFTD